MMQVDKIHNGLNPNFGALRQLNYKGYYADSKMSQDRLTEALEQSKGVKEFFDKYDGKITFNAENGIGGLGNSRTDACMNIVYKKKYSLFPQKSELWFGVSHHNKFAEVTENLCKWLKQVSFNDLTRAIKYKM